MKVLYIGPYKDGTGWAHAAHENILALDAAGVDVVPRPIKLNDVDGEVHPRIIELESKSDKNCDVVIQNCLPHHMDYNGYFKKNIAYYFTETSHFRNNAWAERLNLMDEAWVACPSIKRASLNSNVSIPINIVPVPCDVSKYQKSYKKLDIPHLKDKFTFYTIGEGHRRKNLSTLIKAFHLEFKPEEDVALVVKANLPGLAPHVVERQVSEMCNTIKDKLKLYRRKDLYLSEVIITQHLNEEDMMRLHATCNCYVSPSYGEGWNMPAFDAMAMGKTPICSNEGGPSEFLTWSKSSVKNEDGSFTTLPNKIVPVDMSYYGGKYGDIFPSYGGWLVEGKEEPVFGMDGTFADLYVGNESWFSIDVYALMRAMREAYEDHKERENRAKLGMERAYDYSHINVGNIMKELLNG